MKVAGFRNKPVAPLLNSLILFSILGVGFIYTSYMNPTNLNLPHLDKLIFAYNTAVGKF